MCSLLCQETRDCHRLSSPNKAAGNLPPKQRDDAELEVSSAKSKSKAMAMYAEALRDVLMGSHFLDSCMLRDSMGNLQSYGYRSTVVLTEVADAAM